MRKMVYKRQFKEGFLRADVEKALNLTCRILGKRLKKQVSLCDKVPEDIEKIGTGKLTGITALISGGKSIRFNFKYNSSSGNIESIDLWMKPRINPHFTIDANGIGITKLISIIVKTFIDPRPNVYTVDEDDTANITSSDILKMGEKVEPASGGIKSNSLSDSINAWFKEMQIDEDKLSKTRIKHLYNQSYLYWYKSVRTEEYALVSESSFRNYLIQSFEKNGIVNVFMRTVTVTKSGKEKQIVNKKDEDEFDKMTYAMTLRDTVEYLKTNVRLVTRGFENAIIVAGTAGSGKSRLVLQTLKDDKVTFDYFSGGIKNPEALFGVLSKHNAENKLLVFDDSDEILSKKAEDITKAILGPEKIRKVIWYSAKYKDDNRKFKPELNFKSRVIIITNLPKRKISPAITSRTAPIEINVKIPDLIDDIRVNLDNIMPEFVDITFEMKQTVLDYIESVVKHIDQFDYRLFFRCVKIYSSGSPEWKKFIMPLLRQEPV